MGAKIHIFLGVLTCTPRHRPAGAVCASLTPSRQGHTCACAQCRAPSASVALFAVYEQKDPPTRGSFPEYCVVPKEGLEPS